MPHWQRRPFASVPAMYRPLQIFTQDAGHLGSSFTNTHHDCIQLPPLQVIGPFVRLHQTRGNRACRTFITWEPKKQMTKFSVERGAVQARFERPYPGVFLVLCYIGLQQYPQSIHSIPFQAIHRLQQKKTRKQETEPCPPPLLMQNRLPPLPNVLHLRRLVPAPQNVRHNHEQDQEKE